ncbi:class I SAM-dependent methyltransferase [Synechococcus sp. CCY 9618]|uniref:class I SAM-dependent methyltransferase n=1 Tax=Synechococcus sp. CCY 9618 TaxID=2815602 RepID=UPI001C2392C7|nr:class I SAM-dependent methyltransferase [Synechococcus sp. CCY 9618]
MLFRGCDPYFGIDANDLQEDLQGWGSDHPILTWAVLNVTTSLIIEVGSWKGRSAINMAKVVRDNSLECEILCIDTWLGSPEHWLASGSNNEWYESLKILNGRPDLYKTFLGNVILNNCRNIITPFPLTSDAAFHVLKALGVSSSLIYIDAGHDFATVARDIENYWQLLCHDGIMILDDYLTWPGVTKAVDNFASEREICVHGEPGKAIMCKSDKWSERLGTTIVYI